ncbi:hypothetical protein B0H14DRAFT_3514921 [Mycena olivaceomarginata]|nr:hypothetical protein B0H14DRAFT_3514921 [Mycena olivaceomarginata]
MAPAQLSCLDPICARLVKRTSGDMMISGRVYVFWNDLLDPKEAAPIPALTSTPTADDRISSSPYAIQVYPRIRSSRTPPRPPPVHAAALAGFGAYVTIQSILSRRSSPRAARPYDCRAIPMRFPTTHTVFEEVHPPRAEARRTWPRRWAPRDNTWVGGGWLGPTRRTHPSSIRPRVPSSESSRDLCPARGGDAPRARRAPTHPPSEAIGSLPRFKKIKNAESGGAECRPVPCTRGSTAPARSRALSTPSRSGVCPGAGRGCIAAHRASSSVIHLHSQRRAHYTRASSTAVLSIGAAAGELSPPQVHKQLSLGLDYTSRPTIFSRPSVHLMYTAQDTGAPLHPVLPAGLFATHLISSRRALPRLDHATVRFRGDAGSRSTRMACSPVRRIRPSRISTARRGVRGGASALRLGDVHAAAWVFGTPQAVYRLGFHDAVFVLLEQQTHCALSAYPPPVSFLRGHGVPRRRCAAAAAGDRAA